MGQRVAISAGGRTWDVTLEKESVEVAEGAGAEDASIGGNPSDVLLWLWGRLSDEHVTRSGDEDAIGLLRSRLALATQ
jgi:hypothetical protein